MPRETSSTTLQRPDLGALAYEFFMGAAAQGFIGTRLLPVFEVADQSADYPKIPIESFLKLPEKGGKRAARSAYDRDDYQFETDTYQCVEYGLEAPVDDTEARLFARYFDAEAVATARASLRLQLLYEKRVAALLFGTGTITNTAAVSTEWSTPATCTPLSAVMTAKTAMRAASGLEPNVVAMSKKVFNNLMLTTEIKNTFAYTTPVQSLSAEAKRNLLAQYFEVDEVLVAGGMYDSAKPGQSFSLADIWDDEYVGLYRVGSGGGDLRDPIVGRTFLWTADAPQMLTTEQYREEQVRSWIYRVRQYVDEAIVFAGAGYLLSNITV